MDSSSLDEEHSDNSFEDEEEDEASSYCSGEEENLEVKNLVSNEVEKGQAVKDQQELWSRLCECRIKLQKILLLSNKLPQFDTYDEFKESALLKDFNKGYKCVHSILDNLFKLQNELLCHNPEKSSLPNVEGTSQETDEDNKTSGKESKVRKMSKRKCDSAMQGEILAKRHKELLPYRDSVIQKWDDKTRLSSGHMSQKSFNAFGQSALQQINQVLQDKHRLLSRTQNKRANYKILGSVKTTSEENSGTSNKNSGEQCDNSNLNEEIFDDDDFYHQFLKDIIESKSVKIDSLLHRKHLEIQTTRKKLKKKVDTKASKGRRLRFTVHPKLLNFMSSVVISSDEGRSELLSSLFGQHSTLPLPLADD